MRNADRPLIVDVREPRAYRLAHIPEAQSLPLPKILTEMPHLPHDRSLVMVCRSGRRSQRAAEALRRWGYVDVRILEGGMLAWESADLLEAVE